MFVRSTFLPHTSMHGVCFQIFRLVCAVQVSFWLLLNHYCNWVRFNGWFNNFRKTLFSYTRTTFIMGAGFNCGQGFYPKRYWDELLITSDWVDFVEKKCFHIYYDNQESVTTFIGTTIRFYLFILSHFWKVNGTAEAVIETLFFHGNQKLEGRKTIFISRAVFHCQCLVTCSMNNSVISY